eukprot:513384_1
MSIDLGKFKMNGDQSTNNNSANENLQEIQQTDTNVNNTKSNKFITSFNNDDDIQSDSYYAFGERYKYSNDFKSHPLFVEAKYNSIQEELFTYYKDINEISDKRHLLVQQIEAIKSIPSYLQPKIKKILQNDHGPVELWYGESIVQNRIIRLMELQQRNCTNVNEMLNKIFQYVPMNITLFSNYIFVSLLNAMLTNINTKIRQNVMQHIKTSGYKNDVLMLTSIVTKDPKNIELIAEQFNSIMQTMYSDVFTGDLSKYQFNKGNLEHEYFFADFNSDLLIKTVKLHNHTAVDALLNVMQVDKHEFYDPYLQNKCGKYTILQEIAKQWSRDERYSGNSLKTISLSFADQQKVFMDIFYLNYEELIICIDKQEKSIISLFENITKNTIQRMKQDNEDRYIRFQNHQRCQPYIEKAKQKIEMFSVKRIKAIWYHGMNVYHHILPNDPLRLDHIIAMILYADISELCTLFRGTYRKIERNESLKDQKRRHSKFSNMGRLLYESFIFFASTNSNVTILYHGMSFKLLFSTLYCAFNAPTSTTTASSVATTFGETGIVIEFESSESSKYIRTMDMGIFSRYSTEEEHLIFETRLHIKNIFIPQERVWMGYKRMKTLSLYDMLTHGNTIHDMKLMTNATQKRLHKLLNGIMNNTFSTRSKYANSLIKALIENNSKMWLNSDQIQQLNDELKELFVRPNGEFGSFIAYLRNKHTLNVFPVFSTIYKMSDDTLELISRVSDKYKNIIIKGRLLTCKLEKNKYIIFRPQMMKVHGLFEMKMELMNVSCDSQRNTTNETIPVKIQFNLKCPELQNYYTLLHPRLMDVKFDNSFDITLPLFDTEQKDENLKSISFGMTIVLHNYEEFNISYQDFTSVTTERITHNMIVKGKSYKCADFLSLIYGLSNSVVSVLDSISDIAFIFILSYYVNDQQ